eukprot:scaffold417532_cov24-Prasinocladus_malaysianus.AAC.1
MQRHHSRTAPPYHLYVAGCRRRSDPRIHFSLFPVASGQRSPLPARRARLSSQPQASSRSGLSKAPRVTVDGISFLSMVTTLTRYSVPRRFSIAFSAHTFIPLYTE